MYTFDISDILNGINPESDLKVGFGYIILPTNISREEYIKTVFGNYCVYLYDSIYKTIIKDVYVDKQIMNDIEIPLTIDEKGSPIVYLNIRGLKFIISIFKQRNGFEDLQENSFHHIQKYGDSIVEIFGKAKEAKLNINVFSITKDSNVTISSKGTKNSQLNVNTNGKMSIYAGNGLTIQDQSGNQIQMGDKIKILPNQKDKFEKTVEIGENAEEPAVLGKHLSKLLKDFFQEVSSATVNTGDAGVQPLLNSSKIKAYSEKVDSILSKILNIK